jgi:hypothetical protein
LTVTQIFDSEGVRGKILGGKELGREIAEIMFSMSYAAVMMMIFLVKGGCPNTEVHRG